MLLHSGAEVMYATCKIDKIPHSVQARHLGHARKPGLPMQLGGRMHGGTSPRPLVWRGTLHRLLQLPPLVLHLWLPAADTAGMRGCN